jgi:hypothetical protein
MTEKLTFKVAYDNSYGRFALSKKAVKLARILSGDENWGCIKLKTEKHIKARFSSGDSHHLSDRVLRHDPILIQVIETLGEGANGGVSDLRIKEIQGNRYRINVDEGLESVITPDNEDYCMIGCITLGEERKVS